MKILVINAGSSSIKYQLFDMEDRSVLAAGLVERIGEETGRIKHETYKNSAKQIAVFHHLIPTHLDGLHRAVELLLDNEIGVIASPDEIAAVGHRVVHGGEKFSQPTVITDEVIDIIEALSPLAPLHNPANLTGIRVAKSCSRTQRRLRSLIQPFTRLCLRTHIATQSRPICTKNTTSACTGSTELRTCL